MVALVVPPCDLVCQEGGVHRFGELSLFYQYGNQNKRMQALRVQNPALQEGHIQP